MKYFKEYGPSYNWEQSKGKSLSEFLGIGIKTLDDGGSQFCQTVLIRKVLEVTVMEYCNGLPTSTKVKAPLVTDMNSYEATRYWPNSYASVIWMMLYLTSNTRPDISFDVHQCVWFKHNTKSSHNTAVKRICRYLQGTKNNVLVFNLSKKLVVDCYYDTYFAVL